MTNASSSTQRSLRSLAEEAESLARLAPTGTTSMLAETAQIVNAACTQLARVVESTPRAVSTLHLARFCSSAETLLTGGRTMAALYGHAPAAEVIDTQLEVEMRETANGLRLFAQRAHADVLRHVQESMRAASITNAPWNTPDEDVLMHSETTLSSAFHYETRRQVAPIAPSVSITRRLLSRVMSTAREHRISALRVVKVTDAQLDVFLKELRDGTTLTSKSPVHIADQSNEATFWKNERLDDMGLMVASRDKYAIAYLTNTLPQVNTTLWNSVAERMCGDPKSLHRAMAFKDDPDFRSAIRTAMISAMGNMERQINEGLSLPNSSVQDPVVRAAITSTLVAMGHLGDRPKLHFPEDEVFNPFELRASLQRVMDTHPGLAITPTKTGLRLMSVKTVLAPQGVAYTLRKNVDTTLNILRHFQVNGVGKRPQYVELPVTRHCKSECGMLLTEMIKLTYTAYAGDGNKHWLSIGMMPGTRVLSTESDGEERFYVTTLKKADFDALIAKKSSPRNSPAEEVSPSPASP